MIRLGGFEERKPVRRLSFREFLSLPEVQASNLLEVLVLRLFFGRFSPALGFRFSGEKADYDVIVPIRDGQIFKQLVSLAKQGKTLFFILTNVEGKKEWGVDVKDEPCVWEGQAWGFRAIWSTSDDEGLTL